MKPKNTRAPTHNVKTSKAKPTKHKLPPDPDGMFKRAAARAEKVLALYDDLFPDLGEDYLIPHLLHDLMHFCDRHPTLKSFDESHGFAIYTYERFVKENKWIVG